MESYSHLQYNCKLSVDRPYGTNLLRSTILWIGLPQVFVEIIFMDQTLVTFIELFVIFNKQIIITNTSINIASSRDNDVYNRRLFLKERIMDQRERVNTACKCGGDGAWLSCVQGHVGSSCRGGTAVQKGAGKLSGSFCCCSREVSSYSRSHSKEDIVCVLHTFLTGWYNQV